MGNTRARRGLLRLLAFTLLLSGLSLLLTCLPASFAHSGDNEAFGEGEGGSVPKEVSVDSQGIHALGIETARVDLRNLQETLKATGEVQADETRAFNVNPPVTGLVKAVMAKQGDLVKTGQTLAIVHSVEVANNLTQLLNERTKIFAEIARVKTQYTSEITLETNQLQLAKSAHEREESLFKEGISAQKNFQQAKNAYDSATIRLATLKKRLEQEIALLEKQLAVTINTAKGQLKIMGISEQTVDAALATGKVTADLPIKSPVSGCVVKREMSLGERVDPSRTAFTIVNLSPIWVMVDIFQEQIPLVKEGQEVFLETPSKERLLGRISSVGSVIDSGTKTLHVRIIADNPRGVLRPGMFVTAEIVLGKAGSKSLSVPESAVVYFKDRPFVYIHHADEGHFEPTVIAIGKKVGGRIEVVSGLHEGDLVVVTGASQLLAQALLKPESGHEHEGEKHEDHHGHESEQAPQASNNAQLVMGFGLGIGFAVLALICWFLFARSRKKVR